MAKILMILVISLISLGIIIFAVSSYAESLFNRKVADEVKDLLSSGESEKGIIEEKDLAGLPAPVQRWLKLSGAVGKEKSNLVHVKQKIEMRLQEGKAWMPAEAEQYFTVDKPGFVWKVKAKLAPLVNFTGRDMYYKGHGYMKIKVLSLFTVADGYGKEIDQSTMLRYLGECASFPTMALSPYIKWEAIDDNSARAVMSYEGITDSGVVTFDDQGNIVRYMAKRYRDVKGSNVLTEFYANMKDHKEVKGIRIPTAWEAGWKLETGDFTWFKAELTEVEYNA